MTVANDPTLSSINAQIEIMRARIEKSLEDNLKLERAIKYAIRCCLIIFVGGCLFYGNGNTATGLFMVIGAIICLLVNLRSRKDVARLIQADTALLAKLVKGPAAFGFWGPYA